MNQIKNDVLLKKVALQIKQLRKVHKVSQQVFYNDTGIHIARIERGRSNISLSTLDAICTYFGTTPAAFFKAIS